MRKLWIFFGIIVFGMTICAGCGNRQSDISSSDHSVELSEISEKSYEQSTQEQSDSKNTDSNNISEESKVFTDTNTNQPSSISIEESGQSSLSMEERYRAILLNNGEFVCTDLQNKGLSIEKIKEAVTDDDSVTVAVSKFAYIDLNGDGANEIVLWIQINGISDYGFEILQYQEDAVYGYTLPYTAFMNLKTDGTFIFSGGAADSGIGKLKFAEGGYIVDRLYYSESGYDSNNELEVQYFANGEKCSEEEFNDIMRQQEEKQNIEWYDLTSEGVSSAFGK